MKDAQKLLQILTKAIPPCKGCNHNITLNGDNIVVTLMTATGYYPFLLGVPEFSATIEEIAADVIRQYEVAPK